jgi:hypothetical protein
MTSKERSFQQSARDRRPIASSQPLAICSALFGICFAMSLFERSPIGLRPILRETMTMAAKNTKTPQRNHSAAKTERPAAANAKEPRFPLPKSEGAAATKPAPNQARPSRPKKAQDVQDIERADSEGMAQPQGLPAEPKPPAKKRGSK